MNHGGPTPEQPHASAPHHPDGAALAGLPTPAQSVEDCVQAQQALGASWGEAVGLAAEMYGEAAVAGVIQQHMSGLKKPKQIMGVLDDIAKWSPTTSNAWLNGLLAACCLPEWDTVLGRGFYFEHEDWVRSLPKGLKVKGHLFLTDCESLKFLPTGLDVKGSLNLWGCLSLVSLPPGMKVGGRLILQDAVSLKRLPEGLDVGLDLDLQGCMAWDGQIPDSVYVGRCVYTDSYPRPGIPLHEWRKLHPQGERIKHA